MGGGGQEVILVRLEETKSGISIHFYYGFSLFLKKCGHIKQF